MTDMQPENLPVPNGTEQVPVTPAQNAERIPVLPTPEGGLETGLERAPQTAEASVAAANAVYQGAPITPIAPVVDPADPVASQPITDSPAIAGDEDVIEKEWVDKAKKIIQETKDDPFGRSSRVNQLQKDYLMKRYNKELGTSQ